MENLYHETNRLIQEMQECFQRLDRDPAKYDEIESQIQSKIELVNSNCERLSVMTFKVPVNQRPIAKMRCDQLKYDNRHIQAALVNYQNRRQRREQESKDREQLLSRRFTAGHDQTEINVDYAARESNSLLNSHRNVDEMLDTGSSILDSLRNQRETLKGAHRKLVSLANTLGLSNATISLIERRVSQDKYILFGGMFVTLVIVTLVIIYLT